MTRLPAQGPFPLYLANRPETPNADLQVTDKYRNTPAARVALADAAMIDRAIAAATSAAPEMAALAPYQRQAVLRHCIERFDQRAKELATVVCIEAGKPIRDSHAEVTRLIDTFQIAADEAVRPRGQMLNLEIGPRTKGYRGWVRRFPIGPCSFISPFNFPLNLVAHKIAPAIAAGCPFVLKPASLTPISALIIGEILAETDLPEGAFSILPARVEQVEAFATDPRLKLLSFTGSPDAGWKLRAKAGKKKVILELGGNAACIVDAGSDVDDAARRLIIGAFYQSGQSCISVQRIYIHDSLVDELKRTLIEGIGKLKSGDPLDEEVSIGPMISESAASRLEEWIQSAIAAGAKLLCGGGRDGAMHEPTLLEDVPEDQPLSCQEAFGPVAVIERFSDFEEALDRVNRSRYGIHAGVFTPSIDHAFRAWDRLEVGGVLINEVPSFRVDNMPYGGVKESGIGREGVACAIESMTEARTMVIRSATR
ncbi:MAG: aldehyde dehydrogenase family protein [Phycisphaeraceae bacterium]|nr:aldehyde dehydrogenase family protein [Phycisphaeraceae bacterium]